MEFYENCRMTHPVNLRSTLRGFQESDLKNFKKNLGWPRAAKISSSLSTDVPTMRLSQDQNFPTEILIFLSKQWCNHKQVIGYPHFRCQEVSLAYGFHALMLRF